MAKKTSSKKPTELDACKGRVKRLRKAIAAQGCTSMLVTSPVDVAYLTGFLGGDSFLYVPPAGKPWMISDSRYEEDLEVFTDRVRVAMRSGSIYAAVGKLLKLERDAGRLDTAAGSLAIQADHTTLTQDGMLRNALKEQKLPQRMLRPVGGVLSGLREKKDALEVSLITAAVRIQEAAFESMLEQIGPGMTEQEITAILEYEMKVRGSTKPGFTTIVGAEPNGSMSHYVPGTGPNDCTTRRGGTLLIDWGALYKGYHGDMTRVLAFGKWKPELKEIYQIALDAHEAAAAVLRPGVTTAEVDRAARDHIAKAGYGDCFGHGLGHGMGLEIHEGPRLSHMTEGVVVEPGHVYTIEPGIYLPGIGGVRIEDDYLVTERGRRNLSRLPKDLEWATR